MERTAPRRRSLAPAPAAIEAALALIIEPGQVTELRILDAVTASDRRPHIESGYFDDVAKLAKAAATIKTAKGWYFTPNPLNPALLARAKNRVRAAGKDPATNDRDIVSRRWLLIDLDAERPAGISATDGEHEAALALARTVRDDLAADGWPDPICFDSGNGAHLMYRVDLPADDGGIIERCLAALDARHGTGGVKVDKTVHNPARIWKLYGTPAGKGDSTDDRPHRMAKIVDAPETLRVVPRDLLDALAATAPSKEPPAPRASHGSNGAAFDVATWLAEHSVPVAEPEPWQGGERWIFDVCPWNSDHTNRSAYVLRHKGGAVSAGCHHNSCAGRDWHALRDVYEPGWRNRKTTNNGGPAGKAKPVARRVATIEPYQPFPVEALPEPIRGFVTAGAAATRCDESYVALPLLSALAAAVGNARRLRVKDAWHAPPIVWSCIVGESGDGKSPPMKLALRPVSAAQRRALRKYDSDKAAYDTMLDEWERARSAKKRSRGDLTAKPVEPVAVRYVVSDTTVEALAKLLSDQPRGLLLTRDEFAGWFGSHDAYRGGRGGDTAHWLSMYDGGELIVDRKGGSAGATKRPIYVAHAAVSITGGIQPAILARALGQEHFDNGLAARILFAYPPRRRKQWTEADVDRDTVRAVESTFAYLYALESDVDDEGEPRPKLVRFTPGGKRAWIREYNALADEAADLTGDLAAAASKLEGYVPRLALIVHCLRQANGELLDEAGVDEASVEAAAMLTRWFGREARRIYQVLRESPADGETRRLVDWIAGRGGHATARETQQAHRRYGTADEAESALQALVESGYGEWHVHHPHRGPSVQQFRLQTLSTVYGFASKPEEKAKPVDSRHENEPESADCEAGDE